MSTKVGGEEGFYSICGRNAGELDLTTTVLKTFRLQFSCCV